MKRTLAATLAASVLWACPGLTPYTALAQLRTQTAPTVEVVPGATGGMGVQPANATGAGVSLGRVTLDNPLMGSVAAPSRRQGAVTSAGSMALPGSAALRDAVAARPVVSLPAAASARAAARRSSQSSFSLPVLEGRAAQDERAAPTALENLTDHAAAQAKAEPASDNAIGIQNTFFDAMGRHASDDTAPEGSLRPERNGLDAPDGDKPGDERPEPAKPVQSLKRSFQVGLAVGVLGLFLEIGIVAVAAAFGYELHGNYQGPGVGENPTAMAALRLVFGAAVLAPITEEVIFRGALEGGVRVGLKRLWKNEAMRFWIPAVISSVIFVLLHETADPLLIAVRLMGSLIMSRVFYKEGLTSSIVLHAVHNGIGVAGIALSVLLGPLGALLGMMVPMVAIWQAWVAKGKLAQQKEAVKAGLLQAYRMTTTGALVYAVISLAGAAFLAFSPFAVMLWGGAGLMYLGIAGYKAWQAHREDRGLVALPDFGATPALAYA